MNLYTIELFWHKEQEGSSCICAVVGTYIPACDPMTVCPCLLLLIENKLEATLHKLND